MSEPQASPRRTRTAAAEAPPAPAADPSCACACEPEPLTGAQRARLTCVEFCSRIASDPAIITRKADALFRYVMTGDVSPSAD